jgi:predicted amidophosphoribosyltransferase
MSQCEKCGRADGIRKYNMPNRQDKIYCQPCYRQVIQTGEYLTKVQQPQQVQQPQGATCASCGASISPDFKVCPYCGKKIEKKKEKFCVECGTKMEQNQKFCGNCGKEIS